MNLTANRRTRRALAAATLCSWQRLGRVVDGEVDVFDRAPVLSQWSRIRLLPRMARWAVESGDVMKVLGLTRGR